MSGRKASEVNSLLRNGEKTRSASMDIMNSSCKKVKKEIENAREQRKECERTIRNIDFNISESASNSITSFSISLLYGGSMKI